MLQRMFIAVSLLLASISYAHSEQSLLVGTWNIEHLASKNGAGCFPRSTADYLELKRFASSLDADIIALQEVQNLEAIRRIFDQADYNVFVSSRPEKKPYKCRRSDPKSPLSTHQATAFVIKKGIEYKTAEIEQLSPNGFNRYGLVIQLPGFDDLQLINLHLKSKCFSNGDHSNSKHQSSCQRKFEQVKDLNTWLEDSGTPNRILLGDFNRRLAEPNDKLMEKFSGYRLVTSALKGCNPKYPKPIDHILTSPSVKTGLAYANPFIDANSDGVNDSVKTMLSDHCPVMLEVKL
ncbi:endonuclease/exonuclease/phosphatase family protein [Vibrio mediterranei]|uniref:endonuclease/exonuclease/phosphatase family protein n=1 Tax=Vibrio mediterranei TaxID=689 RepID=UPI0038CE7C3D